MNIKRMLMLSTSLVLLNGSAHAIPSSGAALGTITSTHTHDVSDKLLLAELCPEARCFSIVPVAEVSRLPVIHLFSPEPHLSPISIFPTLSREGQGGYETVVASVCFITDTGACGGSSFSGGETYPDSQPDWNIDNNKRCQNEGYAVTSCNTVQTPANRCPYNSAIFEKCVCKPSLKSCASPYVGVGSACDGQYAECCNTCPEYTYTPDSIPEGYVSDGSCDSCDGTKHKITPNPCTGFPAYCECGYDTSSASCKSGSSTRYKSCKSCCSADYIYNSSNCPSPHKLIGDICGGKYKKCELPYTSVIYTGAQECIEYCASNGFRVPDCNEHNDIIKYWTVPRDDAYTCYLNGEISDSHEAGNTWSCSGSKCYDIYTYCYCRT